MSKETWKEIKGYEGLYQVSNLGRIKSLPKHIGNRYFSKEKIMKPQLINGNRLQVRLSREGTVKNFRVHRLVAENFIKNPYNLPQVNHIDENPQNNNVNNLEWCDAKYNSNYGTRIKRISEKHKKRIISLDNSGKIEYYDSTTEAQQKNNVSRSSIIKCCKQKQKTSLGLRWFYLEDYIKILIDERDKIKQEYDRDTHILQNRLDLANAKNIEKDKIIDLMANSIATNDSNLCQYLDITTKCKYYAGENGKICDECIKQYFERQAKNDTKCT